jgi:hypothetical protein
MLGRIVRGHCVAIADRADGDEANAAGRIGQSPLKPQCLLLVSDGGVALDGWQTCDPLAEGGQLLGVAAAGNGPTSLTPAAGMR